MNMKRQTLIRELFAGSRKAYDDQALGVFAEMVEEAHAHGEGFAWVRKASGLIVQEGPWHNTVCTAGKNAALDAYLAGSSYTVTGPYMGLISSASYSAIAAADTMSSHAGWLEAVCQAFRLS